MEAMPELIDELYIASRHFAEVMFHYFAARKFRVLHAWYARMRTKIDLAAMQTHLTKYADDPQFVSDLISTGEKLLELFARVDEGPMVKMRQR
jgi:hypothetical protein